MTDYTIFDGVIINENSFTELFKNFLRFKIFRESFLNLIDFEFDKANVDFESFDTQLTITKFGRPDLGIVTKESEILFEIKVWDTALTQHQPLGYYNYLKSKSKFQNKGLILIVPKDYYNVARYDLALKSLKSDTDNIHTQIIHWDTIVNLIANSELESMSLLFQEYYHFLIDWFHINSISFDSLNVTTMFGKEFPESLEKTMLIIDGVFKEFKKRGYAVKFSSDKYFAEYGFNFTLLNDEDFFFGIWFDYWKESGNPICICFYSEDSSRTSSFDSIVVVTNLSPIKEFKEFRITFIDKSTLMDSNAIVKVSKILDEFAVKLNVKMVVKDNPSI